MKTLTLITLLLSSCQLYSKSPSTSQKAVRSFIDAINAHSIENISTLLTDNHVFTDAQNKRVSGKEKTAAAWKGYFEWFPDYKIEVENIIADGDTLALFGFAEGTYHNLKQDTTKAHWRLPASWKAVVRGNKIALWQIYADTKLPFEIIQRYAIPADKQTVTGFGGVFFKSKNPKELGAWYDTHLGTSFGKQGYSVFYWRDRENKEKAGSTTFGIFKESTTYFSPGTSPFMFNFRVVNLKATLERLKKEGVQVIDKTDSFDYGDFGWIIDADGNKIELWEPRNEELFDN